MCTSNWMKLLLILLLLDCTSLQAEDVQHPAKSVLILGSLTDTVFIPVVEYQDSLFGAITAKLKDKLAELEEWEAPFRVDTVWVVDTVYFESKSDDIPIVVLIVGIYFFALVAVLCLVRALRSWEREKTSKVNNIRKDV